MELLQDTERVWWYIQRECQDVLDRPLQDDERVAVVIVVSALTKLLSDD